MYSLEQLRDCIGFEASLVGDDFVGSNGKINFTGQSHWAVSLTYNGQTICTDYHMGSAHREYAKRRVQFNWNGRYSVDEYNELKRSVPIVPDVMDVLASLASDAQSTEYNDFDDWCDEYGYSNDSIKALNAYHACCDTRARLQRMFDLEELYVLFQDY